MVAETVTPVPASIDGIDMVTPSFRLARWHAGPPSEVLA